MKFIAVHSVTPKAGLLASVAGQVAGVKHRIHIFTGQVWYTKNGLIRLILKQADRLIVRFTTRILVDGRPQRDFLIKEKIVRAQTAQVLGKGSISGVDTKRFVINDSVREEIRSALGLTDEIVFMYLGRINREKGVLDLAQAFKRLNEEKDNVRLLIAGYEEDDTLNELKLIVPSRSLILFGPTETPERLIQACDIFCLPSHREGFGTSVIEASLLEKPIICSDTYGLLETILDNRTGLRHLTGDINSIYGKMKELYKNKRLRMEMGREGRKYVLENFTAEKITQEWLKFYDSLIGSTNKE